MTFMVTNGHRKNNLKEIKKLLTLFVQWIVKISPPIGNNLNIELLDTIAP